MFRTEVQVPRSGLDLTLQHKVLTIGSCFADVIGSKLQQHKVDVQVNPFGTIFNPISVSMLLQAAAGRPYTFEEHLVQHNGIWYAYDLHSSLSSTSKEELLQSIQQRLHQTGEQLKNASLLIVTLGTAIAYRLQDSGKVVANCHKLPAANFKRVLLTMEEMSAAFEQMLTQLKQVNPSLKILLTVSPVRHIKESIEMNSVSKASLRLLCHQLQVAHPQVLYFPAYEIMMDDLRDYRYYKEDMLHPTPLAEAYIWQKFVEAYYTADFRQFIGKWEKIQRAVSHRPFHPHTEAHQKFLRNTLQQLQAMEQQYNIDVSSETEALQNQLLP
ncbi:GSCFA domain-containing protein [Pontibacter anaerobius]|uniref:GSCFA domain-containing protein n=1 Tax=Pontibacter anaerobius TaxID=2993940 RepID=A0ABT3RC51_9BACT|nr:GSCFA domain-containing protein [Pontibacter anaerobius]MCX2738937.1 GSCFA domain-containing protein [Pontibacter anaerobius]